MLLISYFFHLTLILDLRFDGRFAMGFATVNGVVKSASESNLQKQHWHFSQTFYIKTFVISSKSSTKVLFVSSASSPIEVNFRCKKEASLRLLSSAIREQNTFQRHIFFPSTTSSFHCFVCLSCQNWEMFILSLPLTNSQLVLSIM